MSSTLELTAIDCLLQLSCYPSIHNFFTNKEYIRPPRPTQLRCPTHYDFPTVFEYNGMNFDNAKDLPEGIADASDFVRNYHAKQLHHDDPDFPAQPPDLFCNDPSDRMSGFTHVADMSERRLRFLQQMKANRATNGDLFRPGRRHYVKGAVHQEVEGLFYIPEMEQPTNINGDWETSKYRLTVEVMNANKESVTTTYVEFGHTPLHESCKGNTRGVAKQVLDSCIASKIKARDIRDGVNLGHMACAGSRLFDEEVIKYANTHAQQKNMLACSERWLIRHKFGRWVNNLRRRCLEIGHEAFIPDFGDKHWISLLVHTSNYGNECHLDMSDDCQGITMWTEKNAAPIRKRNKNVGNWYFLFPDVIVVVDGKRYNGFAIPLQHGTVVTWDARLVRHCTAVPEIKSRDAEVYGTYFGVTTKIANHGRAKKEGFKSARHVPKKKRKLEN